MLRHVVRVLLRVKPVIAVDWDGTCVESAWPERTRVWMPGAIDALKTLTLFSRPVIFSSRVAPMSFPEGSNIPRDPAEVYAEIAYIRDMLDEQGLTDIEVWTKGWKPGAVAYVDDKGVHYSGRPGAWKIIVDKLAAMCGVEEELRA